MYLSKNDKNLDQKHNDASILLSKFVENLMIFNRLHNYVTFFTRSQYSALILWFQKMQKFSRPIKQMKTGAPSDGINNGFHNMIIVT